MSRIRSATVALLLVSSMVMTSPAAAGSSVNWGSRLLGHSYVNGNHHAWGKLRVRLPENSVRERIVVVCSISMIWIGKGTEYDQGGDVDYVTATLTASHPHRVRHFFVVLPDPNHLLKNIPGRWDTGCGGRNQIADSGQG